MGDSHNDEEAGMFTTFAIAILPLCKLSQALNIYVKEVVVIEEQRTWAAEVPQ